MGNVCVRKAEALPETPSRIQKNSWTRITCVQLWNQEGLDFGWIHWPTRQSWGRVKWTLWIQVISNVFKDSLNFLVNIPIASHARLESQASSLEEEQKQGKSLAVSTSLPHNTSQEQCKEVWWLIFTVNSTGFRIVLETNLWT